MSAPGTTPTLGVAFGELRKSIDAELYGTPPIGNRDVLVCLLAFLVDRFERLELTIASLGDRLERIERSVDDVGSEIRTRR